jgi:hypothetical protein
MSTVGDAADVNPVIMFLPHVAIFHGRERRLPPRSFVAAAVNRVA